MMMNPRIKIGERIRQARMKANLTQKELAHLLGLQNEASMGHMEKGRQEITLTQIETLARVLRVDRSWLAFGEEDKK